jgi:nicotinate-nucleotide adenylyltransferase
MMRRLGVLGGTFDPVHHGHLDAARAAQAALDLTELHFIPAHDPPHRRLDPHATAFHRFAMVALAIAGCPAYRVSDLELLRQGSSYTADTLRSLQNAGWRASQIFFILGSDAFAEIATWHAFPAVLDAAHFVVVTRHGTAPARAFSQTPELRTRIRTASTAIDDRGPTGIFLVEADTRDVSSTAIRQRLAAGEPIDDLVPSAVAKHIAAHQLYRLEDDLHASNQNNDSA